MTNYEKMQELLINNGMNQKVARGFVRKFKIDEVSFPCSDEEKKWAMMRGFFPGRIKLYGLTEDNYQCFLPDYVDFQLHPYNNHFVVWINDKLSLRYTLGGDFNDIIPKYYLYIENNGDYTYLNDAPKSIPKNKDFILNLLGEKKILIMKPNSSKSGGAGVMKVEYIDGSICINNKTCVSNIEFEEIVNGLSNYIVTEYARQHQELMQIWPDSACTLRIIMVKLPHQEFFSETQWRCIISFARFGTSVSGGTSNLSAGGVGVGFDFETGIFKPFGMRYMQFCPDGQTKGYEHPNTHVVWKDYRLPNWNYVKNTIFKICNHYGSLSHLGFDVIITDSGFVLCEINSKPAINYNQVICGPVLSSDEIRSYFNSKGMDKIDCKELYEIYKQSQE